MSPQFVPEPQSSLGFVVSLGSGFVRMIEAHPGVAAWLQAAFSILAIWIALRAAGKARRREHQELSQSVAALLEHAAGLAIAIRRACDANCSAEERKIKGSQVEILRVMRTWLHEVPLIQLRPPETVRVFLTAQSTFDSVIKLAEVIQKYQDQGINPQQLQILHSKAKEYVGSLEFGASLIGYRRMSFWNRRKAEVTRRYRRLRGTDYDGMALWGKE